MLPVAWRSVLAISCVLAATAPLASAGLLPAPAAGLVAPVVPAPLDAYVAVGHVAVANRTIALEGDFLVLPGADATLVDVSIVFRATADSHPTLRVAPGATLRLERVTITNDAHGPPPERALSWYAFDVYGQLTVRHSRVEFARFVQFYGPTSTDNLIETSTFAHGALGGLSFTKASSGTVRGNHFLANERVPMATLPGGGVTVYDTHGVLIEGNLFEDVLGDAVVVVQSTGTGSYVWQTSAIVRSNLFYDSSAPRDPARLGTRAVYVEGANPDTRVEKNAIAAAWQGITAAYGTGVDVASNDVLSVALPGAATNRGENGLHANGADVVGTANWHPYFEENRVRGFVAAAAAVLGGHPSFHGNSFDDSNLLGLVADNLTSAVEATANWWGPEGPAGRTDGDVLASPALTYDPTAPRPIDVTLVLEGSTLHVLLTSTLAGEHLVDVVLRNAPGAHDLHVRMREGLRTIDVALTALPPNGTDVVALALSEGGFTAVAATRAA